MLTFWTMLWTTLEWPIGEMAGWWTKRQQKRRGELEKRQRAEAQRLLRLRQERTFRQQVDIARRLLPQIDPEAVATIEREVPEGERDKVYVQVLGVKAQMILGEPEDMGDR